ncbi:hypothetical protein EZV62_018427 [Acer yangbiense]|uniref:Endonuclease/exonuclease/phosphatase domain-containing protein n=1 Tax=Acer yangbiense TaxID=1000413 RepID=A0A5C7HJS8_9ROSI|nr:hypothetical protein EZV62_018427 [Acer yangbiense]
MKTLVWNVRGFGNTRAFQVLLRLKQKHNPDLLFLVETKTDHVHMENVRVKLGFVSTLVVDSIERNGGLCLFWSSQVDINLFSFSQYHIDIQVSSHRDLLWRFTRFLWSSGGGSTASWIDIVTST